MPAIIDLLIQSLGKVWITFTHNWPFLLASVLISVGLRLYVQPQKVAAFITRYRRVGIIGATAAAVTTPFCSCGTTAVILGMIASTIPWAPIVAFMVASPLTSPEELVYSAGLFGWPFAIAFFVSSILLGLLGGVLAEFFESRGWLANQARFPAQAVPNLVEVVPARPEQVSIETESASGSARQSEKQASFIYEIREPQVVVAAKPGRAQEVGGGAGETRPEVEGEPGQRSAAQKPAPVAAKSRVTARQWIQEIYRTGRQLLPMFLGFALIGYLLNGMIPPAWISAIFGSGNVYSVPLAATLGLPFYINSEGSLPLVRALIDGGMSQGAALAFLITGAGTSLGAVTGALTIARWRVIGLVVGTLWVGAILLGYGYDLLLALHLF